MMEPWHPGSISAAGYLRKKEGRRREEAEEEGEEEREEEGDMHGEDEGEVECKGRVYTIILEYHRS
jgi:hypothetical protein